MCIADFIAVGSVVAIVMLSIAGILYARKIILRKKPKPEIKPDEKKD